jgi:hypothetical protein
MDPIPPAKAPAQNLDKKPAPYLSAPVIDFIGS